MSTSNASLKHVPAEITTICDSRQIDTHSERNVIDSQESD